MEALFPGHLLHPVKEEIYSAYFVLLILRISSLAQTFYDQPEFLYPQNRRMSFRVMDSDSPIFSTMQHLMDLNEAEKPSTCAPTKTYVRDAKAMAATPADVKEYPNSYVFVIDMPGLKSGDIKVQGEDDNILVISGERKKEDEKKGVKYLRMERRIGKFKRKFVLPDNANTDSISAVCQEGVLSVTVEKLPPPEPKKPKTISVQVCKLKQDSNYYVNRIGRFSVLGS